MQLMVLCASILLFNTCISPKHTQTEHTFEQETSAVPTLRIHYHRDTQIKDAWSMWVWLDVDWRSEKGWPSGKKADGVDFFGYYYDIPLLPNAKNIGIIAIQENTGQRDGGEKFFSYLHLYKELWIFEGDDSIYISEEKAQHQAFLNASLVNEGQVVLTFVDNTKVDTDDITISRHTIAAFQRRGHQEIIAFLRNAVNPYAPDIRITAQYKDEIIPISLGYELVDAHYANDEQLGVRYSKGSAVFTVWAPLATSVQVVLYDPTSQFDELLIENMSVQQRGIWSLRIDASRVPSGDLHGHFYQYLIANQGNNPQRALDPYAESMAVFFGSAGDAHLAPDIIGKGAIIDPSRTAVRRGTPRPLTNKNGASINEGARIYYELDIRNFSSDEFIQDRLDAQWGTYDALTELVEYFVDLGVTHVIIRGVLSTYHYDERNAGVRTKFDDANHFRARGFDAHHFFAPEGFYSVAPYDPASRIRELKNLVHAFHAQNIGVIPKVSYSKIARATLFERLVPHYYILNEIGGNMSDQSRYYNSMPYMAQRLVLDSVEHLFTTYGFDGIFLEHMGSLDRALVERIHNRIKQIYPTSLVLGDGTRSLDVSLFGINGADIDWNPRELSVAMLNQEFPRIVTTQNTNIGEAGFVTGRPTRVYSVFENLLAKPSTMIGRESQDLIQYLNDYTGDTLFDRLFLSQTLDPNMNFERLHYQIRIAHTLLLTARGSILLVAGQELGKSKAWQGYQQSRSDNKKASSSDFALHFPWEIRNNPLAQSTRSYVRRLIDLRKTISVLHQEDIEYDNDSLVYVVPLRHDYTSKEQSVLQDVAIESDLRSRYDDVIAYGIRDSDGTRYMVYINTSSLPRAFFRDFDIDDAELLATIDGFVQGNESLQSYINTSPNTIVLPSGPSLAIIRLKPRS